MNALWEVELVGSRDWWLDALTKESYSVGCFARPKNYFAERPSLVVDPMAQKCTERRPDETLDAKWVPEVLARRQEVSIESVVQQWIEEFPEYERC